MEDETELVYVPSYALRLGDDPLYHSYVRIFGPNIVTLEFDRTVACTGEILPDEYNLPKHKHSWSMEQAETVKSEEGCSKCRAFQIALELGE